MQISALSLIFIDLALKNACYFHWEHCFRCFSMFRSAEYFAREWSIMNLSLAHVTVIIGCVAYVQPMISSDGEFCSFVLLYVCVCVFSNQLRFGYGYFKLMIRTITDCFLFVVCEVFFSFVCFFSFLLSFCSKFCSRFICRENAFRCSARKCWHLNRNSAIQSSIVLIISMVKQ